MATLADTFLSKLLGLMFSSSIDEESGLLLADQTESTVNSAIHMLFMKFDICVIWIDKDLNIVDVKYAKKWFPFYAPKSAAKYTLEISPIHMQHFSIGDQLSFNYAN